LRQRIHCRCSTPYGEHSFQRLEAGGALPGKQQQQNQRHPDRPLKRCATDSRNPLQQATFDLIVELVLDYVGPGHWCFVAEVSSLWRDTYKRVASREMQVIDSGRKVGSVPQMTLYSSIFGSASRVRHATAHGLSSTTMEYQRAAGRYADVATLQAAHAAGMRYSYAAMDGAARCNAFAVVQFLRTQGCP
jgi:hypothetical protein